MRKPKSHFCFWGRHVKNNMQKKTQNVVFSLTIPRPLRRSSRSLLPFARFSAKQVLRKSRWKLFFFERIRKKKQRHKTKRQNRKQQNGLKKTFQIGWTFCMQPKVQQGLYMRVFYLPWKAIFPGKWGETRSNVKIPHTNGRRSKRRKHHFSNSPQKKPLSKALFN